MTSNNSKMNVVTKSMTREVESIDISLIDLNIYCLSHILSFLPIVERIRVQSVCKNFQDASKMSWRNTTRLSCPHNWTANGVALKNITLQQLEQVLRLCGQALKCLDFCFECNICDHNIKFQADERFFAILQRTCPNLQLLDISVINLTREGISFMTDHYHNLTDLRFSYFNEGINYEGALADLFARMTKLRAITVHRVNGTVGRSLLSLPTETMEGITILSNITVNMIEYLCTTVKNCRKLNTLSLRSYELDYKSFDPILEILCENKTDIRVLSIKSDTREPEDVSIGNIALIANFKNLHTLKLKVEDNLTDVSLKAIGDNCKLLSSANIDGSNMLSDKGFTTMLNLQHLDITFLPRVTGKFFELMPKLQTVKIDWCGNITNTALESLLNTSKRLKLLDLFSVDAVNMKEFVKYATEFAENRTDKVPLTILMDDSEISDVNKDFLRIEAFKPW